MEREEVKTKTLITRNANMRLLEPHSKRERNVVRINLGNTLTHELAKFYLNWTLRKEGFETVTECRFLKNYARGDIFDLDNCSVHEVLQSETKEKFYEKKEYYPSSVTLIAYNARDLIKNLLEELKKEGTL